MKNYELFNFIKNEACKKKKEGFLNLINLSEYISVFKPNSEIKNLKIKFIDGGDWSYEEKFDLSEGTFHVTSDNGHNFYIKYSQSRSDNYNSGYFYHKPELNFIEKDDYETPIILYTFKYKNFVIKCGDKFNSINEYACIFDTSNNDKNCGEFKSTEEAIEYINHLIITNEALTLWHSYENIKNECKKVNSNEDLKIPKDKLYSALSISNSKDLNEIRNIILPICIEYKLEQISFWSWIKSRK